jgi:hypothetical protein
LEDICLHHSLGSCQIFSVLLESSPHLAVRKALSVLIVDDFRVLFEPIYKSLTANLSCQTPTKYVLTHKSHCKWDIWMQGLDVTIQKLV